MSIDSRERETDAIQAGLFSAILTAFNVPSYPLLQPASSDQTAAILLQISAQLASFSINPAFVNSTQPSFSTVPHMAPSQPARYLIWLNSLWFTSLVLSLSSATVGIMVKQWLKEYNSQLFGTSQRVAWRRQYRLNNLRRWHVPTIIKAIPVLLLMALVLFLIGLVILLFHLQRTVASIVAVPTATLLFFLAFTTLAPTFSETCCYEAPQAAIGGFICGCVIAIVLTPLTAIGLLFCAVELGLIVGLTAVMLAVMLPFLLCVGVSLLFSWLSGRWCSIRPKTSPSKNSLPLVQVPSDNRSVTAGSSSPKLSGSLIPAAVSDKPLVHSTHGPPVSDPISKSILSEQAVSSNQDTARRPASDRGLFDLLNQLTLVDMWHIASTAAFAPLRLQPALSEMETKVPYNPKIRAEADAVDKLSDVLDCDVVLEAYAVTLDAERFVQTAGALFSLVNSDRPEADTKSTTDYFSLVWTTLRERYHVSSPSLLPNEVKPSYAKLVETAMSAALSGKEPIGIEQPAWTMLSLAISHARDLKQKLEDSLLTRGGFSCIRRIRTLY